MVGWKFPVGFDGGMGAEQPPERDAFAGVADKQAVACRQPEFVTDWDVNVANVSHFIGHLSQLLMHFEEKRPFGILVDAFQLVHLDEKFIETKQAYRRRTTRKGKRILFELADKVGETQPHGIGFDLAGLITRPVARFFR